jgi:thiol-disulfide isomerase/thioredoxin
MKTFIKTILLLLISISSFSQNILVQYVGNKEEHINLSYSSRDNLVNRTVLSKSNRTLKTDAEATIVCDDMNRSTLIYAQPNEAVDFVINEKGLISYSCKTNHYRKSESEFLNESFLKYGKAENVSDFNELKLIRKSVNKEKYFDKQCLKEIDLLETSFKNDKVSKEFYEYCSAMYWSLCKYNELEANPNDENVLMSIKKSFSDDKLIDIEQYRQLLYFYVDQSLKKEGKPVNLLSKMKFIANNFTNQKIIDYLLYYNIYYAINLPGAKSKIDANTIELFRSNCKNQKYIDNIDQDLQPKPTPIILDNIVKKYKGQLVLIDFWASWCMPCREEFPNEKKLIEKYPKVAFLFISTDKSSTAWKKAMAEYTDILNKENSFLLVKSDKDELLKKLKLSTIPRYVLFGKDGKIINSDAPRPSSIEIEKLIENYL